MGLARASCTIGPMDRLRHLLRVRRARGDLRRHLRGPRRRWVLAGDGRRRGRRPHPRARLRHAAACCSRWRGPAHEITGLDLSAQMLERCRRQACSPSRRRCATGCGCSGGHDVVRPRPPLRRDHLPLRRLSAAATRGAAARVSRPLPHPPASARQARARPAQPVPAPPAYVRGRAGRRWKPTAELVDWTDGTADPLVDDGDRLRARAPVQRVRGDLRDHRSGRRDAPGRRDVLLRYVFRFELEHLLVRAGFRVVALYGDYDGSPFGDDSPAMIAVAEPLS